MDNEYVFGQQILVREYFTREHVSGRHRQWILHSCHPTYMSLIGIRTLSNGHVEWEEGGRVYEPQNYFKALLVVKSLSSKPIFIPMINEQNTN